MISASDTASAGTPVHSNGGETSPPSHEYLRGTDCPAAKAVLISSTARF
jgi:hypothetical protein